MTLIQPTETGAPGGAGTGAHASIPEKVLLGDDGALRCSTEERERTGAVVQEAAGEGRLDLDEATQRMDVIYAARFRHELDAVTADLPGKDEDPTRWSAIAALARHRLADDVARLTGGSGDAFRSRRVVLGILAVIIGVLLIVMAFHGIVGEGPEHGEGLR